MDPQPPFYPILLRIWMRIFGTQEAALRALSLLAGLLTIPVIYITGKTLINKNAGIYAAALLTYSPLHIWYAQEARGYTLATLLTLSAFYFFYMAQKYSLRKSWSLFILLMTMAIFTNYFSILLIVAGWIFVVFQRKNALITQWSAVTIILAVLFSTWIPVLARQIPFVQKYFSWVPKPEFFSLVTTIKEFSLGYITLSPLVFFLNLLFFTSICLLGILRLKRETSFILLIFFLLPISITYLIGQRNPVYITRQLMIFSPFYYLLVAAGIDCLKFALLRFLVLLCLILYVSTSLLNYYRDVPGGGLIKKPFKPALFFIEKNWQKHDVAVHAHPSTRAPFRFYRERFHLNQTPFNIRHHERIWLISSSWLRNGDLNPDVLLLNTRLSYYYDKIMTFYDQGIVVDLFVANKEKFRQAIEDKARIDVTGQDATHGLPETDGIKKTIVHAFAAFAAQDMDAAIKDVSSTFTDTSTGKTSDFIAFMQRNNEIADRFFSDNLIFYITGLTIHDLRINTTEASAKIILHVETWNTVALQWVKLKQEQSMWLTKEEGAWKIQRLHINP